MGEKRKAAMLVTVEDADVVVMPAQGEAPRAAHASAKGDGAALTALVQLYPQPGAPIVRALVVDRTPHTIHVHFEAADDGTLLVRLT